MKSTSRQVNRSSCLINLQTQLEQIACELGLDARIVPRLVSVPSRIPTHVIELGEGVFELSIREEDLPLPRSVMIHEACHIAQILAGCPRIHSPESFSLVATAAQSLVLDMNVAVEMKIRGYQGSAYRLMLGHLKRWERGVEYEFESLRDEYGVGTIVLAVLNWALQAILFFPRYQGRARQLLSRLNRLLQEDSRRVARSVLACVSSMSYPLEPRQIVAVYTELLQALLVEPQIAEVPSMGIVLLGAAGERLCNSH